LKWLPMPSARIYRFPRAFRGRPVPSRPAPARTAARRYPSPAAGGFTLLLFLTIPAAFLYLSGAAGVARHDSLYAALLAAVWGFYFIHDKLLRIRVLGPLLVRAGRLLLLAGVAGFVGGIYWLIFSKG